MFIKRGLLVSDHLGPVVLLVKHRCLTFSFINSQSCLLSVTAVKHLEVFISLTPFSVYPC